MIARFMYLPGHQAHWSVHRLILVVLAVAAIVIGVLSMHSANPAGAEGSPVGHGAATSQSDHFDSDTSLIAAPGHTSGALLSVADDACEGICGPEICLAVGMACAAALIAMSMRPRGSLRWLLVPPSPSVIRRILTFEASRLAPTPSLIALSISRT